MKTAIIPALFACTVVGACARTPHPVTADCATSARWRTIVTDDDGTRLRGASASWTKALAAARAGGAGVTLDGDAALFSSAETLDTPVPPPGDYRCTWYKLGSTGTAVAPFTAYAAQPCRIAQGDDAAHLTMLAGPQRPIGSIYDDEAKRAVFLGTLQLGDESVPLAYGRDEQRDMGGYVDRIGARRWRLVLPQPHFESLLDVIEIVPAT